MMTTEKKVFLAKIRSVDDAKEVVQEVIDRYNQAFKSGSVCRYDNLLLPIGWRDDLWMKTLREDIHKDSTFIDEALDHFAPDDIKKFSAVWITGYRKPSPITEGYSKIVDVLRIVRG